MFKLVTKLVAPWPVPVRVVAEDGSVAEQTATLLFERVGEAELRDLLTARPDETPDGHNLRFARRVVKGWRDVLGEGGNPLPFNDAALLQLLDFPGFASALGQAYARFHAAATREREAALGESGGAGPAVAPASTAETPATASA
jgi:hypothetical protein